MADIIQLPLPSNEKLILSDEVVVNPNESLFLVKKNGIEVCFCTSEMSAILIVDSLAADIQKKLTEEDPHSQVYRQDIIGERKTIVSVQKNGVFFSGIPIDDSVYTYLQVSIATVIRQRLKRDDDFSSDEEL